MKKSIDYSLITESPGHKATKEQVERLGQRYWFARNCGDCQRVLEVGCGTGMGLNYLTRAGKSWVVGGDVDPGNLAMARRLLSSNANIALVRLNAQDMPFRSACFDKVVCFEAIYYFPDPTRFVSEVVRLLRPGGLFVLGTVNCAWPDFHISPYTYRYFNNLELVRLLSPHFSSVEMYGGFLAQEKGARAKMLSVLKRVAIAGNLIPGSLQARALLKRMFIGPLEDLPTAVTDKIVPGTAPEHLETETMETRHKILYAVAQKTIRV